MTDNQSNEIIVLEDAMDPLIERFNTHTGKIRFLSLLSPTCPMWRDKGARAVHESLFEKYPDVDFSASIVWIPMLEKDTVDAASPSVNFLNDNRIHHFFDNNKNVGKAIANSVGWAGRIAWDIYLFYKPSTKWSGTPPKPNYWMHQLSAFWTTRGKYRTGDALKNELIVSMEKLR